MKQPEKEHHWNTIFQTKDTTKVSWYQQVPYTALKLIKDLNINKSDKIIDIGCGDSFLPDYLLKEGYTDISVLDISEKAIQAIRKRLANHEPKIKYFTSDVLHFNPDVSYSVWYDRAVFHFLNDETEIQHYVKTVSRVIKPGGFLILSTFSTAGPKECSGLPVKQYNENSMSNLFHTNFKKLKCFVENHQTPSGSLQNFLHCLFQKNNV